MTRREKETATRTGAGTVTLSREDKTVAGKTSPELRERDLTLR